MEELHARYENEKQLLLEEMKHNFGRMRDIFARDDERLELMSIVFEARNDDDTQQTHANFEDSIAVLNNEVCPYRNRSPIDREHRTWRLCVFIS